MTSLFTVCVIEDNAKTRRLESDILAILKVPKTTKELVHSLIKDNIEETKDLELVPKILNNLRSSGQISSRFRPLEPDSTVLEVEVFATY